MPVTYLTSSDRLRAEERRCNEALSKAIRLFRGLTRKPDLALAEAVGIGRTTLSRYKDPDAVGNVTLNTARRIAKETKMSPEDWLKVGGYK